MSQSMAVMRYHLFMWKIGAVWPFANKFLFTIYFALYHGIFSLSLCTIMIVNLFSANDLNEATWTLLPLSTLITFTIKSMFVLWNRSKLLALFTLIDHLEQSILPSTVSREKINRSLWESKRLIGIISFCYYFGCTSFFMLALWSNERVLVWSSWMPFDYKHSAPFPYYVALVYQYLCTIIPAAVATSVDTYGSNLNNLLATYFDILAMQLKHIGINDDNDDDVDGVGAAGGGNDCVVADAKLQLHEKRKHNANDKSKHIRENEWLLTECAKCHICCVK